MLRIHLTEIFVDDQEAARAFYTDKLGFQVKTDAAYGPDTRWLTVVAPGSPDVELLLNKADDAAEAFRASRREAGVPTMSFTTDDIEKDYETLSARGVTFTQPPTRREYGGTDAVFEDGCGNILNLHQDWGGAD
jgi:catechol 2,3-dioxygenase-like lactoylglutathione lyase family enzyme